MLKRVYVPEDDHAVSSPRQKHIKSFGGGHEANVVVGIASRQRCNDNVTFLALIVV